MVGESDIKKLLFLDIESVSGATDYASLSEMMQKQWQRKAKFMRNQYEEITEEEDFFAISYKDKAGIYAEFGKIICISVGILTEQAGRTILRVKSYQGHDEKLLLTEFAELLVKHYPSPMRNGLCGHNIKEFDIPYICRRMLVHQIPLPDIINLAGKKPWEAKHLIDTLELWKFGDIKNFTSLDLLTAILDIPSPKDDIDGSMVGHVYWEEKDLPRIVTYCEKDVVTVVNLMMRYSYQDLLQEGQIIFT